MNDKISALMEETKGILDGLRKSKGDAFVDMVCMIKTLESMTSVAFDLLAHSVQTGRTDPVAAAFQEMSYGALVGQAVHGLNRYTKLDNKQMEEALQMAKVLDRYVGEMSDAMHAVARGGPGVPGDGMDQG